MGLIGTVIRIGTQAVQTVRDELAGDNHPPDGEELWDGADDLYPPEPVINETASEPELIVTRQWGLRLPGGHIAWNSWANIPFHNPLDRLRMVATLKRTAGELGFGDDQLLGFLSRYDWMTRNQIATVVYEDTGAYPLTDPEVSALGTPDVVETTDDGQLNQEEDVPGDAAPDDPHRGLCEGPVGGPS